MFLRAALLFKTWELGTNYNPKGQSQVCFILHFFPFPFLIVVLLPNNPAQDLFLETWKIICF